MIQPDVEGAIGGSGDDGLKGGAPPTELNGEGGDDTIVGTSGADTLEGRAGADSIVPLGGPDAVFAGAGVDLVSARDGEVDAVDCGPDGDHVHADPGDVLLSCEPPPPPDPPAPPAPRIITETITLPSRVGFDLAYTFTATRKATVLRNLAAEVEPGARLTASCRTRRGGRCTRTRDLTRSSASASVRLRGFEGKRLPVGAKLAIRVTKDGSVGVLKTLTIRRRRAPSLRTLCVPPGATVPSAC
jgi:hypothetical protein